MSSLLPLTSFTTASATLGSFQKPLSDGWGTHLRLLFGLFLLESESEIRARREGLDVIWPNCVIFFLDEDIETRGESNSFK